jgi:hypothetical protein
MTSGTHRRVGWPLLLLAGALLLPPARPCLPSARASAGILAAGPSTRPQSADGKRYNGYTLALVGGAVVAILLILKR